MALVLPGPPQDRPSMPVSSEAQEQARNVRQGTHKHIQKQSQPDDHFPFECLKRFRVFHSIIFSYIFLYGPPKPHDVTSTLQYSLLMLCKSVSYRLELIDHCVPEADTHKQAGPGAPLRLQCGVFAGPGAHRSDCL